jgi:hypothetical protein
MGAEVALSGAPCAPLILFVRPFILPVTPQVLPVMPSVASHSPLGLHIILHF